MSLSSSILLLRSCFIVPSSFWDIKFILFPSSSISSLDPVGSYFLLKSNLDILFAITFNSSIGLVNLLETYETAIPAITIAITPIINNKLLEILTLSSIAEIGIWI